MTPRDPSGDKPKKPDALLMIATPKKPGNGPPPLGYPEGIGGDDSTGQECASCKFFDGSSLCLYFPPLGGAWASVLPENWCGQWAGGTPHVASPDAGAPPHAEPDAEGKAPTPGIGGF